MKKLSRILLPFILSIVLTACAASSVATPPANVEPTEAAVVAFADPMLEEMVSGALGQPDGGVTLAQAQAVTRLDLSREYERYLSEDTPIKDINGLEKFTNLESLDLSYNAVTDISPLAGLTKLTTLVLGGNPVADVSPLAGLTGLKLLVLSDSQASDYSALANLVDLQVLMLDKSTITDLSPLAALTNLRQLYLAKCVVDDFAPLETIYPNLENKDFTITSTLIELGFTMDYDTHQAQFEGQNASFSIHHNAWGPPPEERFADSVRLSSNLRNGYVLKATFYPEQDAYAFGMGNDGTLIMNYVYDAPTGNFTFGEWDRASSEQTVLAAMDVVEGEDVLLAPVRVFNDIVNKTFGRSTKGIYAMPFEPPSLRNLGFFADQPNAVYLYEYRSGNILDDVNMEVHRPEWGEKEFDVRFFTSLSEEYRIVITWHEADRKFIVSADDNNQGGASFEYSIDTGERLDTWCSDNDLTVEEYFVKAYNDPAIVDVYQQSVDLMMQYVRDTFGMTIEELYSLPTGE